MFNLNLWTKCLTALKLSILIPLFWRLGGHKFYAMRPDIYKTYWLATSDKTPQNFTMWECFGDIWKTIAESIVHNPALEPIFPTNRKGTVRFEASPAEQAQIDWKEHWRWSQLFSINRHETRKESASSTTYAHLKTRGKIVRDPKSANAIPNRMLQLATVINIVGEPYRIRDHF